MPLSFDDAFQKVFFEGILGTLTSEWESFLDTPE
jgi:hypothetical protein